MPPSLMEIGRFRWYSSPEARPARGPAPIPVVLRKSPIRFVLLALGLALFAGCRGGSQQKPGARENAASPPAPPPRTATPAPDRLAQSFSEIIRSYRKIIVLLESEDSMTPAERYRAAVV